MEDAAGRRFLGVLAGAGVVPAAGGGAAFMANSRDPAAYDAAVEATWRHSDTFELPSPDIQKELVRYATLAANSHNTQPWRFPIADRAIFALPDLTRRLGHCQIKFYTARLSARTRSSFTVFAHESLPRSVRFETENCLYLFALAVPSGARSLISSCPRRSQDGGPFRVAQGRASVSSNID